MSIWTLHFNLILRVKIQYIPTYFATQNATTLVIGIDFKLVAFTFGRAPSCFFEHIFPTLTPPMCWSKHLHWYHHPTWVPLSSILTCHPSQRGIGQLHPSSWKQHTQHPKVIVHCLGPHPPGGQILLSLHWFSFPTNWVGKASSPEHSRQF